MDMTINEGFDGIIIDGQNGFLCEAGNSEELALILNRIRNLSPESLKQISYNAQITAREYSDSKVASKYINQLKLLL